MNDAVALWLGRVALALCVLVAALASIGAAGAGIRAHDAAEPLAIPALTSESVEDEPAATAIAEDAEEPESMAFEDGDDPGVLEVALAHHGPIVPLATHGGRERFAAPAATSPPLVHLDVHTPPPRT
jgi:hypothetical protein